MSLNDAPPRVFSQPTRQIIIMLLVLAAVAIGGFLLAAQIRTIIFANIYLNAFIGSVFVVGVFATFWLVSQVMISVRWLRNLQAGLMGHQFIRPPSLIASMKKIQGQSTSNAASISQKAAVAALNGDQGCVADMSKAFKERHDYIVEALNELPGVSCLEGAGTFYAFANVEGVIADRASIESDTDLAEFFLTEAEVAVVPGSAFGSPGHVRLSFASSLETLQEAISRVTRCLAS